MFVSESKLSDSYQSQQTWFPLTDPYIKITDILYDIFSITDLFSATLITSIHLFQSHKLATCVSFMIQCLPLVKIIMLDGSCAQNS